MPNRHSRVSNVRGRGLYRLISGNPSLIAHGPRGPTFHPAQGRPDVLDIMITKNIPYQLDLSVVNDLDSDHDPVLVDSNIDIPALVTPDWTYEIDWDAAVLDLNQTVDPRPCINSIDALEAAATAFTQHIRNVVRAHTYRIPCHKTNPTVIPNELRQLLKAKSAVRKLWQRFRHPL